MLDILPAKKKEQLFSAERNQRSRLSSFEANRQGGNAMATFHDPVKCFAPLEVIERLLEIRGELGFQEVIYLDNSLDLADFLDAYGFDVYSFSTENEKINYGDYRATIVPGGDFVHGSLTAH